MKIIKTEKFSKWYKKLDIINGDDIDIVASALDMPFDNCEVDAVILQSVPEVEL